MFRARARIHRFWRLIAANFFDLRLLIHDSRIALLGFGALSVVSTLYLLWGYSDYEHSQVDTFTPLSALFETLRMLVLQSGLPLPRNDRFGQILFFLLPLLGLALVFQSVLNFGRYLLDKGSRREAWQIALASTYRDHVIVCGLGRVGYRAVRQLVDTGFEVVVVERNWQSEFVSAALELGVPVVLGDGRQSKVLAQAGLLRARGLLAAIGNDLLNLEVALTAREQRPGLNVVLRIFDDTIDSNIERGFGRNSTFSSSALAAPTLAAAAVTCDIAHVLTQGKQLIGIAEITIQRASELKGLVREIESRFDLRIVHHSRQNRQIELADASELRSGDCITLLGALDTLEQLRTRNRTARSATAQSACEVGTPATSQDTVIVCGLGRVGYRVIAQLRQLPNSPHVVAITETNAHDQFRAAIVALGARVVVGDARSSEVLREAGIDQAYSVAAVTGNDLLNVQIGLAARQHRSDIHVVLRVFSEVLAAQLESLFGIHTTYSTSDLAAPTLAASCVLGGLSKALRIGNQLFGQIDLHVDAASPFANHTVAELRRSEQTLVIALQRAGVDLAPSLETRIQPGDEIALLAPLPVLARFQEAFHRGSRWLVQDAIPEQVIVR